MKKWTGWMTMVGAVAFLSTQAWAGGACCAAAGEGKKECTMEKKAECKAGVKTECKCGKETCATCQAQVATAKTAMAQTMCPIMNKPINKDLYVDYEGKRIYVCCKGCIAAVKKDPAAVVAKMEADGVVLDKVPETPAP